MGEERLRLELTAGASLLLADLHELSNNDLRVVVVEAMPSGGPVETEVGLATPIRPDLGGRGFELTWWRYVAYSVRNESYFQPEHGERLGHAPFGTREDNAFLAYVSASTFATDDYPGCLTHWFLYTGWQCIDVVSDTPPDMRELSPNEVRAAIHSMDF